MSSCLDIVIIADFCSAFDNKGNNRFIYIAKNLIKRGHRVEIVTSDFFHGTKTKFDPVISEYDDIKVTMLHEGSYSKNVSVKRFFAHYKWGKNVAKYLKSRKKPDVIYCAMPTLKAAAVAGKYANKNGVKFIIDVQDLWPEAYKMVFNIPVISSIIFAPFKWLANSAYKSADEIVAVSNTYVDRAMKVNKKTGQGYSVFLGTDLNTFDKNVAEAELIAKENDEIWLGYCGTLGASYDLRVVFDAMKILNEKNLKFVVMGGGPRADEFKNYSKGLNVLFTGKLAYKDMCGVLNECDMVVNPIMHNAAQSIINKHADYAAVGRPVLNTQECKEYRDLVDKYQMGFNVENNNPEQLAEKISYLINDPEKRLTMGRNSRKCAAELCARKETYKLIMKLIEE